MRPQGGNRAVFSQFPNGPVRDREEPSSAAPGGTHGNVPGTEAQLRRLVEGVPDILFTLNPHTLGVTFVNGAVRQLLGVPPQAFVDEPRLWQLLLPEQDRDVVTAQVREFLAGTGSLLTLRLRMQPRNRPELRVFEVRALIERDANGHAISNMGVLTDVTERLRAEQRQQETNAHLQALYEASPDMIFLHRPDGTILDANAHALQTLGYDRDTMLALPLRALIAGPESEEEAKARLTRAGRGETVDLEGLVRRRDGSTFPVEVRLRRLEGTDSPTGNVLAVVRDIGARRRAESALSRTNRALKALSACNRALVRNADEQQLLNAICRVVVDTAGYRFAWVGYIERDPRKSARPVAWAGREDGYLSAWPMVWADVPEGQGPFGLAVRTGTPVAMNVADDPRFQPWREEATKRGFASTIALPLSLDGKVFGTLSIYAADPDAFDSQETDLLTELASDLAFGIGVLRERVERRRAENALRASEARLRKAQQIAHMGNWEWDMSSDSFRCSPETARVLGLAGRHCPRNRAEFLGAVHPDDRGKVDAALHRTAEHRAPFNLDYRLVTADGSTKVIHCLAETVSDPTGEPQKMVGVVQDISRRKEIEDSLRQSATVFECTADGVVITDAERRIVAVNPAYSRITGYLAEEVMGRNPGVIKSGMHDRTFYRAMYDSLAQTGQWQGEIYNRRKNGEVYPEWLTVSTVRNEQQTVTHYVGVFSDISAIKESQRKLDHLAHHDPLTGLPNRLLLLERVDHALTVARRHEHAVAVMFLDLDRFKNINDSLGHPAGDDLLREVAARLTRQMREEDTVARLGGDEFVILLEDSPTVVDIGHVARKILSALEAPFSLNGREVYITASVGVAISPRDGDDARTMLKNADAAMYRAKELGRNTYQYYTADLTAAACERFELENSLRRAIDRREFELHYQIQVSARTGEVTGVEALVRWHHPELGLIPPDRFIPLAEETGLILPLGRWILSAACLQAAAWRREGYPPIRMAVNLSGRQLADEGLPAAVRAAIEDSGIDPHLLELELTESALMANPQAAHILQSLKAGGVELAIDDFGTGYSSLGRLQRFPIDRLKIDRSFVEHIVCNPDDQSIATAIIAMAHSLEMEVVAEGIEDRAQLTTLVRHQCDEMQGYYFSRPLPAEQAAALLDRRFTEPAVSRDTRPTLLLVDDQPTVLSTLEATLRPGGYRIFTARSAQDAFHILALESVDVLICDDRMPEMSGTELLVRVKEIHPAVVRIMLTGYADTETITQAVNRGGVYKFLTKPWEPATLQAEVEETFRHLQSARRHQTPGPLETAAQVAQVDDREAKREGEAQFAGK